LTDDGTLNLGADGSTIFSADVVGTLHVVPAGPVSIGTFTLDSSGSGVLSAAGTGATVTVTGKGSFLGNPTIENGITYIADGTSTVQQGVTLYMYNASTIEAPSGGTIALTDGSYLYPADSSNDSAVVDSGGTISYTSATVGNTAIVQVPLTLNGAAAANRGTLEIQDGGSVGASASASPSNGGIVAVQSELNEPSGVTGDIAGLTLDSNGTYAGPGNFTVPSGQTTYTDGGALSATTLTNNGTVDVTAGGTVYFYNSSVLDNLSTINFTDDSDLYAGDSSADLVHNESTGTFAYTGTSTSSIAYIGVNMDDNGTANVSRGTLNFSESITVGPDQQTKGAGQFLLTGTIAPEPGQIGVISGIVPGSDSTYSGPGELTIPTGQAASWTDGTLSAGADVVVDGTLSLGANFNLYLYGASTLEDSSGIEAGDGTPDVLLNDQAASIGFAAANTSQVAYIDVTFTNAGTLSASFGQLQLIDYTTTVTTTAQATSTNGGHVVEYSTIQPPVPVGGVPQSGSIAGLEIASDAVVTGPGTLNIPTGTTFLITGGTFSGGVTVVNNGTATLLKNATGFSTTAVWQNYGTFTVDDGTAIYDNDSSGDEIVNEATGTLDYAGSSTTQSASIEPPILNEGILGVTLGDLQVVLLSSSFSGATSGTLNGGTYNVSGKLDITETAQITSGSTSTQSSPNLVTNDAVINLGLGGIIDTSNATLTALNTNNGTLVSSAKITLGGKLTSNGQFTVANNTFVVPGGVTLNGASVTTVDSGATLESGTTTKPGTVTLTVPGAGQAAPELTGNGTVLGVVTNGGGNADPAVGTAGALSVTGTYSSTPATGGSPVLSIGVDTSGTTPGTDFGQLAISGAATLGGTLALSAGAGYVPTAGSSFSILTAKSATGTFSKITGEAIGTTGQFFSVSYTATAVIVMVSPPSVKTVSPSPIGEGATSAPVTITGLGFASGDTLSSANTGVTFSHVTVVSLTSVTATVSVTSTATVGTTSVIVTPTTGATFSCASCLTVAAKPTIATLSPNIVGTGASGKAVTIKGTNFVTSTSHALTVSISGPSTGVTAKVTGTVSSTTFVVDVTVPATAKTGKYSVSVLNGNYGIGGCSSCLTIETIPSVTAFSPTKVAKGATGVSVTITGTKFLSGATVSSSNTGVSFSSITLKSSTSITAKMSVKSTASTGAVNVTVGDPGQGSGTKTAAFTIDALPAPKTLSPNSLKQGASSSVVKLTGTGFQTGAKVTFSGTGVTASVTSESGGTTLELKVTVTKTASATKYNVTVTNPDGGKGTCTGCFSVTKAAVVIKSATHASLARVVLGHLVSNRAYRSLLA